MVLLVAMVNRGASLSKNENYEDAVGKLLSVLFSFGNARPSIYFLPCTSDGANAFVMICCFCLFLAVMDYYLW